MGDSSGVDLHRVKTGPLFVEKGEEEGVFFSRKTRRSSVSLEEREWCSEQIQYVFGVFNMFYFLMMVDIYKDN